MVEKSAIMGYNPSIFFSHSCKRDIPSRLVVSTLVIKLKAVRKKLKDRTYFASVFLFLRYTTDGRTISRSKVNKVGELLRTLGFK